MECTTYDLITGKVHQRLDVPEDFVSVQPRAGQGVVLGHLDPRTDYVVGAMRAARPTIVPPSKMKILADGADVAVFVLPVPCEVQVDGAAYAVDDGVLNFRTKDAGEYEVAVQHWPFQDFSVILAAEPV